MGTWGHTKHESSDWIYPEWYWIWDDDTRKFFSTSKVMKSPYSKLQSPLLELGTWWESRTIRWCGGKGSRWGPTQLGHPLTLPLKADAWTSWSLSAPAGICLEWFCICPPKPLSQCQLMGSALGMRLHRTECRNWGSNSRCQEEESPPKALKARGLKWSGALC